MKLSKRDTNLLLVLLGLLIFLGAYLGIANRYNKRSAELEEELSALTPRLEELRAHEENLPTYLAGIDESIAGVEAELERYPADVRSEDLVMYAIELRDNVGLGIESVTFSPVEVVSRFQIVRESKSGEDEFVPMAAMKTGLSTSCEMSYEQMKNLINYIYATEYCTTLERLSVSYNAETGGLYAAADIAKYFVSSQDYEYVPTEVPEVSLGTNDPFKTFTVTSQARDVDLEGAEN